MAKVVTISLAWYVHRYKVVSVTNTTAFKPGEWMTPAQVEKLCQREDFQVHISDNDVIAGITGIVSTAIGGVKL